jgi:hypothetical protein
MVPHFVITRSPDSGARPIHYGFVKRGRPIARAGCCATTGARHANCTAALSMSVSTIVSGMINLQFVSESILGGRRSPLVPV